MFDTTPYREHHTNLLKIAEELSVHLSDDNLKENLYQLRIVIAKLSGKLKFHLRFEDNVLYPLLLESKDESIRSLATQYKNEMGSIAQSFEKYTVKWSNSSKIENNITEFIEETENILQVLAERIEKENNELYRKVESLEE